MPETTPIQNKQLIQRYYDQVVNQRDVGALKDFFERAGGGTCGGVTAEQLVSNPLRPGARLVPPSNARMRDGELESSEPELDALQYFSTHILAAFPDLLVTIDSMVAEGDTVVVRWSARGTHIGDFLGTAPTRRVIPMSCVDYFTFRNGKIASHRGYPDTAKVLARLGQLPLTPIARVLARDDDEDESPTGRPYPSN
jgi:predicted ester cyclase